jgi:hypothetical protein
MLLGDFKNYPVLACSSGSRVRTAEKAAVKKQEPAFWIAAIEAIEIEKYSEFPIP